MQLYPDWEAISAIGQMLGAVGVIVSLIYVGLQVRADARARRTATIQQEFGAKADLQKSLALDADASEIYYRGMRDLEILSDVERLRFSLLVDSIFRTFEASLLCEKYGQLEASAWQGLDGTIRDMLAYPGFRAVWRMRSHQHSPEFQSFIETRIAEALAPRLYELPLKTAASPTVTVAATS